jgi:predicted MFS family arabinose efflux permease
MYLLAPRLTSGLDMVPLRDIAAWRSYVNIVATTGRSLGGPIGGYLADTVGWRWYIASRPLLIRH